VSYSLVAKRLRLPLGFLFAGLYLVLAVPTRTGLLVGAVIGFVGLVVRAWASGHIMKNDRLATSGPYAYTRNPLYFGSFLLASGFGLAAHWGVLLVVALFFLLIYVPVMQRERANIAQRFPDSYASYAAHVPMFLPRLTPWRGGESASGRFSSQLYLKHGEWKAALGYVAALIILVVKATIAR
jgi:protein-S-isoprenylcysteine O-methyltransferase Ste14